MFLLAQEGVRLHPPPTQAALLACPTPPTSCVLSVPKPPCSTVQARRPVLVATAGWKAPWNSSTPTSPPSRSSSPPEVPSLARTPRAANCTHKESRPATRDVCDCFASAV